MKMQEMQCMLNVILWRVHVTIFAGEKQQCMLCVFELNVTANYNYKNIACCTILFMWQIYVASNNKTYVGLRVKCPMLH